MIPLRDSTPTRRLPLVTWSLLAACVGVFMWQLSLEQAALERVIMALGVVPASLLGDYSLPPDVAMVPPVASIFTSMFLHGGWLHLISNMLYLWIFANNVEDSMGRGRFLLFYLLCGVVAVFAQAVPDPGSEIPMIGASGAISGVLGAYLLLLPRARILMLVPIVVIWTVLRLPAVLVLGLWFVIQLAQHLMSDPGQGGVAFGAHVGGFVAGLVLLPLFKRRGVPLFR